MQYIELKIVNTKFSKMSDAERTAALDKIRSDAMTQPYVYQESYNPFPEWAQQIITDFAAQKRGRLKYDDENAVYKIRIDGSRPDFDAFFRECHGKFKEYFDANPDAVKDWFADNYIHITSTPDDEIAAMNDLEAHHRNTALPESRKTSKTKED